MVCYAIQWIRHNALPCQDVLCSAVQCSAVQNVLRYSTLCHGASVVRELFALMNGTKKWNMSPEPAVIAFIPLFSFCWVGDGVSIRAIIQNLVCSTPVRKILGRSLCSPETWHQRYFRLFFNFKVKFPSRLPRYQPVCSARPWTRSFSTAFAWSSHLDVFIAWRYQRRARFVRRS